MVGLVVPCHGWFSKGAVVVTDVVTDGEVMNFAHGRLRIFPSHVSDFAWA